MASGAVGRRGGPRTPEAPPCEETRDDGRPRRDEEDRRREERGSAAVDGGDNDGEGKGATTRTEDEDMNWDEAAEGKARESRDRRAIATAMMTTKEGEEMKGVQRAPR